MPGCRGLLLRDAPHSARLSRLSFASAGRRRIVLQSGMAAQRPPSMPGLLAFEALARLRSVTLAGEELSVTPSAISHRIKQL